MRVTREYTLPIVGTMVNWGTLSGDGEDPLGPQAYQQFMEDDGAGRSIWSLRPSEFDLASGEVICDITSEDVDLDDFETWLLTASDCKKRRGRGLVNEVHSSEYARVYQLTSEGEDFMSYMDDEYDEKILKLVKSDSLTAI